MPNEDESKRRKRKMDHKDVRKQIKNVFQAEAGSILTKELSDAVYKRVSEDVTQRLRLIEQSVKEALDMLDKRSKESLDYVIRQASIAPRPTGPTDGEIAEAAAEALAESVTKQ